jgi:hypothetical protein
MENGGGGEPARTAILKTIPGNRLKPAKNAKSMAKKRALAPVISAFKTAMRSLPYRAFVFCREGMITIDYAGLRVQVADL